MSITTREARQLTTVAEWPVVQSSLPAAIREFSPARLKAKAARARKLWTKYADLVRSQSRAAKGKRPAVPHELNARTKRKAELFAEVFARYEARLSALAAKAATPAKTARPRTTSGTKKAVKAAKTSKTSKTSKAAKAVKAAEAAEARTAAEVAANAEAAQQGMASMLPPSKVKASRGPVVAKGDLVRRSGQVRMQAHVSSRGRRSQGRRDSR
ncbi:MAG: hypothetical protein Q8L86_05785 [Vicinamibacterales bacterium]|nr:hypothetical protein [Vicinamibacterales bacterium]